MSKASQHMSVTAGLSAQSQALTGHHAAWQPLVLIAQGRHTGDVGLLSPSVYVPSASSQSSKRSKLRTAPVQQEGPWEAVKPQVRGQS